MFPAHVDAPYRALAPEGKWGLSHEIPVSKASLYHGDNVVIGEPLRSEHTRIMSSITSSMGESEAV